MDQHHQSIAIAIDDRRRRRRRPLLTTVATTASLLAVSTATANAALLRRGSNNNNSNNAAPDGNGPSSVRRRGRGRQLHDHNDDGGGEPSMIMEGMTNWMDEQYPEPQIHPPPQQDATITPILATVIAEDPIDDVGAPTTGATTPASSTGATTTADDEGIATSLAPPHTDPVGQFYTTTLAPPHTDPVGQFATTTAAATAVVTTTTIITQQPYWYPYQSPTGHRSCVHNAHYPPNYPTSSIPLLFDTEIACCDAYDMICFKEPFWYPFEDFVTDMKSCIYNADYPDEYLTPAATNTVFLFDSEYQCCTAYSICVSSTQPTVVQVKPEKWYPIETDDGLSDGGVVDRCVFDNNYPDGYLHELTAAIVLFETEQDCCTAYHCLTTSITYPQKWYPKKVNNIPDCVYGNDYDPVYKRNPSFAASFLFEMEVECCGAFPIACSDKAWVVNEEGTGCDFGDLDVTMELFFREEGDCLVHIEGVANAVVGSSSTTVAATTAVATSSAAVEVVSASSTGATTSQVDATTTFTTAEATTTTTTTQDPCTNCKWHESHKQTNTCTNSLDYPIAFENARQYFFFRTAQDCCQEKFPDQECIIVDDGTPGSYVASTFLNLEGETLNEDFEGTELSIPFDLGSPPQWELTTDKSHRGSWSLRNLPPSGPLATSDLVLRVHIPENGNDSYVISCMGTIRTSMPWEWFGLFVNGQQRNTYHRPVGMSNDHWLGVMTVLGPGENTLIFRVKNSDVDTVGMGITRYEVQGDGFVYLDDCQLRPQ